MMMDADCGIVQPIQKDTNSKVEHNRITGALHSQFSMCLNQICYPKQVIQP